MSDNHFEHVQLHSTIILSEDWGQRLVEVSNTRGWRRIFFWRKREFKTQRQIWEEAIARHQADLENLLSADLWRKSPEGSRDYYCLGD